jgi:alpha-glucosidase
MQWDAGPHAGFSPADTAKTWLPTNQEERLSVAVEVDDPTSHLSLYRNLLDMRRRSEALELGEISFVSTWDRPNPIVYRRDHSDQAVLIALNLSAQEVELGVARGTVAVSTHPDRAGTQVGSETVMRPWEAWVLT